MNSFVVEHGKMIKAICVVVSGTANEVLDAQVGVLFHMDTFKGHDSEEEIARVYPRLDRLDKKIVSLLHFLVMKLLFLLARMPLSEYVLIKGFAISEESRTHSLFSFLFQELVVLHKLESSFL